MWIQKESEPRNPEVNTRTEMLSIVGVMCTTSIFIAKKKEVRSTSPVLLATKMSVPSCGKHRTLHKSTAFVGRTTGCEEPHKFLAPGTPTESVPVQHVLALLAGAVGS